MEAWQRIAGGYLTQRAYGSLDVHRRIQDGILRRGRHRQREPG